MAERCGPEGWMDVNGQLLKLETISMYDVLRCVAIY